MISSPKHRLAKGMNNHHQLRCLTVWHRPRQRSSPASGIPDIDSGRSKRQASQTPIRSATVGVGSPFRCRRPRCQERASGALADQHRRMLNSVGTRIALSEAAAQLSGGQRATTGTCTYDRLYRLTSATGRRWLTGEKASAKILAGSPWEYAHTHCYRGTFRRRSCFTSPPRPPSPLLPH